MRTKLTLAAAALALASITACSQKTAEEKGAELATEKLDMAKGMGDALAKKGEAAGEAVVGGLGTVVKGIEKGAVKSGRRLASDDSVKAAGLQITKVQDAQVDPEKKTSHGLDVYVVADKDAQGKLKVQVFDALDQEVGRTSVDLKRAADEGKFINVPLEEQLNLSQISKVSFQFKPDEAVSTKK